MAMNAKEFLEALEAIEVSKGISREVVLSSLEEAMIKGFRKQLGGEVQGMTSANVKVNIDLEKGQIEMYQIKDIVEDVEDDLLQISPEDAKEEEKAGRGEIVGNELHIHASVDDLRKNAALAVKSMLRQKFAEAEKDVLFETFKDKIDTMITGKVEKSDYRGCSVNIGRTSVFLPRKEMIADEEFNVGDEIRLYVSNVESDTKGARIVVTRAKEGFLKCLFNEEIREIYDGTIIIKGISREAGERSKVAVYSHDPNVDPAGACIGPNGTRIQKIVAQLGNGSSKEKIDVIIYYDNPALYVIESLKPCKVLGIIVDADNKKATAVVNDSDLSLAIGRRGVNVRLAAKLTGFAIDVKTESQAEEEGLTYQSYEELQALELEAKAKAVQAARLEAYNKMVGNEILPGLPEGYVAPQERVYEEESNDFDEALSEKVEAEELEETKVSEPVEEIKEETPVVETPVKEEEKKAVKTTTTLSDLEKSLESASNKNKAKTQKKAHKHHKEEEEEVETVKKAQDPSTYMSIYTEEELRELEKEENVEESYDDDVDYEDYDEYYDDDDR